MNKFWGLFFLLLSVSAQIQATEAQRAAPAENQARLSQYAGALQKVILGNWRRPTTVSNGQTCTLRILQLPGGAIISVAVADPCDFDPAGRDSIETAALKANPLPYHGFEAVFQRSLTLRFRAEDPPGSVTNPPYVEEGWLAVSDHGGDKLRIKNRTVSRKGGSAQLLVYKSFAIPKTIGSHAGVVDVIQSQEFRCKQRQMILRAELLYDGNNRVIDGYAIPSNDWQKVATGSVDEQILYIACDKRQASDTKWVNY